LLAEPLTVDDVREVIKVLNLVVNDKIKNVKGPAKKPASTFFSLLLAIVVAISSHLPLFAEKAGVKLNVKGGANEEDFEDHVAGDKYDQIADDFM